MYFVYITHNINNSQLITNIEQQHYAITQPTNLFVNNKYLFNEINISLTEASYL